MSYGKYAFREQEVIYLAQRDQARMDALTRPCPKPLCEAQIGQPCRNLNEVKRHGVGQRTVWPHESRTPYMQPANRPDDAIHTFPEAVRRFRERPYLEKYLKKK